MSVRLCPRKRVSHDTLLHLAQRTIAAPSSTKDEDANALRLVKVEQVAAWFPHLIAHLRGHVSIYHLPFRPLVKCRLSTDLVHALCNVLPNLVDERSISATRSMVWIPAHVLGSAEFRKGLIDGLVFVARIPSSYMRGPPPTNLLFMLRSHSSKEDARKDALGPSSIDPKSIFKRVKHSSQPYWVPCKEDMAMIASRLEDLGIEHVGITRIVFDLLGKMIPEYKAGYCDAFLYTAIDPVRIPDSHLERSLRLESLADDEYAIPQREAVEATLRGLDSFSTVLLNGYCGSGKTVMMIELICRYGVKAAVLVNKQDLAVYWKERFYAFAPSLVVKIVSSDSGDMTNADVVVCLTKSLFVRSELAPLDYTFAAEEASRVQQLMTRKNGQVKKFASGEKYPWSWLAQVGLVCVDEAHRQVAATALPCLGMFPNAKILCATATPDRQDQVHDSLGPVFGVATAILYYPYVSIGVITFACSHPDPMVPVWRWKKKKYDGYTWVDITKQKVDFEDVNYSAMIRTLEHNETRNRQLLECIWDAAVVKRKQTLVLGLLKSHLVSLATSLYQMAIERQVVDADQLFCGLLFPETDPDKIPKIKQARVIFATFQFASEAFDVGTLSALVMVSPYKSRLVQVIGRILRRKRGGATKAPAHDTSMGIEASSDAFPATDKWTSLPLLYICQDHANPWFDGIFSKQMRLIRSTYDATVARVEAATRLPWQAATKEAIDTFLQQGQVSRVDKLFADDDDLFGDNEEEDQGDGMWNDEEDWFE